MVDFNKMRSEAKKELQKLVQERAMLDRKIVGLEQTIKGLDAVCSTDTDPALEKHSLDPLPLPPELNGLLSLGLTDAVRKLFENSGVMLLTPVSIRDQLVMYGYNLPQDNPVAAIHAVFRRLEESYEIIDTLAEDGKKGYRWQNPLERELTRQWVKEIDADQARLTDQSRVARLAPDDPARKLGHKVRFPKHGVDTKPNAAFESGMRGNEKPKK